MNDKQLFEREYMGTFEPRRGPLPLPQRPQLAAVLAVLTDRPESYWAGSFRAGYKATTERGGVLLEYDVARFSVDPPMLMRIRWAKTVAEAWEVLATRGLIPLSWLDNPRIFEHEHHRSSRRMRGCPDYCGVHRTALPHNLAEVASIASDARGIETAEAVAGQFLPGRRVIWSSERRAIVLAMVEETGPARGSDLATLDRELWEMGYLRYSDSKDWVTLIYPVL